MAKKKKKVFEVELLDCFKKLGRPAGDLDFWYYVGQWCEQKKELYFVPEVGWFFSWDHKSLKSTSKSFFDLIKSNKECNAIATKWVVDILTKPIPRSGSAAICRETFSAFIALDGQIFLKDYNRNHFLTVVRYECDLDNETSFAYRRLIERPDDQDELYKSEWFEVGDKIHEIEYDLFNPALDRAHKQWLKEYKKTPAYKEHKLKVEARRLARDTNRKMKLCLEVKETIDVLQTYLEDIEGGKATRSQNVKVYNQLASLVSANKNAQTILINDKKSLKK